jgi:hypothetical protein
MSPGWRGAPRYAKVRAAKSLEVKTVIYAQFNPVKTMRQLMDDRCLFRLVIFATLAVAFCR